jgi:hypothetical protein
MSSDSRQLLDLTEFVKSVKERQLRQASAQEALLRAKKLAAARQQFRPFYPTPVKPVSLRF